MAHTTSAAVASLLVVLIFAAMQAFKSNLVASQAATIFGGFCGSNIFVFLLTAVSNVEMEVFGSSFQSKLLPEVGACLLVAMFASGLVHRICITTCVLFSLGFLYMINKIGSNNRSGPQPTAVAKKKK